MRWQQKLCSQAKHSKQFMHCFPLAGRCATISRKAGPSTLTITGTTDVTIANVPLILNWFRTKSISVAVVCRKDLFLVCTLGYRHTRSSLPKILLQERKGTVNCAILRVYTLDNLDCIPQQHNTTLED